MTFLEAWPLFAEAWSSAWLGATLLGLLGVAVVAREQVFLGAAMAQAATAATALCLFVGASAASLAALHLAGSVAVVAATIVAIATGLGHGHREARVALVFLACGSAALLLVAKVPHGLQEVQRLTASSVVGARGSDVLVLGTLLVAVVAVTWIRRHGLVTWLIDPAFAAAIGLPVRRWALVLALLLGAAVGWSLQVAGLLFALGCLVLPALTARALVREVGTALWLAPVLALGAAILGSVTAHAYDLPPAQAIVALLAALALVAQAGKGIAGFLQRGRT